jgi:hypothetical protein
MQETHCPICYGPLEIREVAPCDECGGDPKELEQLEEGYHTYSEYEIFTGLHLTLCNFCDVDFSSYDPTYFGLPKGTRIGIDKMHFIRQVHNPTKGKDKYCPECGHRLSFLVFLNRAREQNSR